MYVKNNEDSPVPPTPQSQMTSPAHEFEPFEDEGALLGDTSQHDMEEEEGEELFGDNMEKYTLLHINYIKIRLMSVSFQI